MQQNKFRCKITKLGRGTYLSLKKFPRLKNAVLYQESHYLFGNTCIYYIYIIGQSLHYFSEITNSEPTNQQNLF